MEAWNKRFLKARIRWIYWNENDLNIIVFFLAIIKRKAPSIIIYHRIFMVELTVGRQWAG